MTTTWKYFLGLLLLLTAGIWIAVFQYRESNLMLITCDVGQGDSILAIKGSFELLTDGGIPNGKAIECLSRYMPFWDRKVEVLVNTHPQLDHYGGFLEVLRHYKVDFFVGNALDASASEYQLLKKEVGSGNVMVVNPASGTSIRYGKIHYDIFYPTNKFISDNSSISRATDDSDRVVNVLGAYTAKNDPNDFSIQAILSFGEFDALLTGDVGINRKKEVLEQFNQLSVKPSIEYLKIPHHGSKNGLTKDYLDFVNPKIAVISVGAKNRYGHPTQEIINLLKDNGIKMYRTDLDGDVVLETDGTSFRIVK